MACPMSAIDISISTSWKNSYSKHAWDCRHSRILQLWLILYISERTGQKIGGAFGCSDCKWTLMG